MFAIGCKPASEESSAGRVSKVTFWALDSEILKRPSFVLRDAAGVG